MRTVLEWLAAAFIVGVLALCLAGCTDDAVIPQEVVTRQHESVPLYTTCAHAREAGVPLPLTPDSPGWNPRLDRDGDKEAC